MRELRTVGKAITMDVKIYDKAKYAMDSAKTKTITYRGVESWEIVTGEDVEEIERGLNDEDKDELHEYVILNFTDGSTSTYRNSHVDLFRW